MATEALKSGAITNRDASPQVKNNSSLEAGMLKSSVGTVEMTTASDAGSTYRFFQVPSNARVDQLLLYADDVGTTGAIDIGVYQTAANGGAVVDADFFASAVDINAAALNGVDVTHESGVYNIDDVEKPLWSALGLSADPCIFYDIVATSTAAASAGGTLSLKGQYAI